jgi:phosphocarrier protein
MPERRVTIINKLGLHARAAAKLVATASRFPAHIRVEKDNREVNAKSIMGIMMLAAGKGSDLVLHADGEGAEEALSALEELIANRFDEDE